MRTSYIIGINLVAVLFVWLVSVYTFSKWSAERKVQKMIEERWPYTDEEIKRTRKNWPVWFFTINGIVFFFLIYSIVNVPEIVLLLAWLPVEVSSVAAVAALLYLVLQREGFTI